MDARCLGAIMILGLALLPGCASVDSNAKGGVSPPVAPVAQLQALWQNRVITTPDVAHKGASLPGLVGRVYLLGTDLTQPVKGDGTLLVDLYDADQNTPQGQQRLLEHYEFPKKVLDQLLRKDVVGWGYTVFLPWPEYQPDIKHVELRASYNRANGTTVFSDAAQLCFHSDNAGLTVVQHTMAPTTSQTKNTIPMRVPDSKAGQPLQP
jgi:hypothetical protein